MIKRSNTACANKGRDALCVPVQKDMDMEEVSDNGRLAEATGLSSAAPIEPDPVSPVPASIPNALRFLAEIVVPVLGDVLDYDGDLDAAETRCDADSVCNSHWCQSGGCIVDKLRFARRVVEIMHGDTASEPVQGDIRWQYMLPAQAIETQSAKTEGLGPKDESAVAKPCAQGDVA